MFKILETYLFQDDKYYETIVKYEWVGEGVTAFGKLEGLPDSMLPGNANYRGQSLEEAQEIFNKFKPSKTPLTPQEFNI